MNDELKSEVDSSESIPEVISNPEVVTEIAELNTILTSSIEEVVVPEVNPPGIKNQKATKLIKTTSNITDEIPKNKESEIFIRKSFELFDSIQEVMRLYPDGAIKYIKSTNNTPSHVVVTKNGITHYCMTKINHKKYKNEKLK